METNWKFKIPNSDCVIEVKKNKSMYETWIEIDFGGRGDNSFELSGRHSTFEEAIENCFLHIHDWATI